MRESGIYDNIPENEYHGGDEVSQTALKLLEQPGGAAKLRHGVHAETRPQKLGSLIHTLVLRPDDVGKIYEVTRLDRANTRAWKAAEATLFGKVLIKQSEWDQARRIRDGILKWSPVARELLAPSGLRTEVSFYWVDPATGIRMRGRADGVREDFRCLIDLKSAQDASEEGFDRAVRTYGYDLQNAVYVEGWQRAGGWEPSEFVFIVVEPEEPYLSASYVLSPTRIEEGRQRAHRMMDYYAECAAKDEWPGYTRDIVML